MLGDHMLFMREDSVELAWSTLTPLLDAIESETLVPLTVYPAGSDGPEEARRMMHRDGRTWRSFGERSAARGQNVSASIL